jgi:hypothetical protein
MSSSKLTCFLVSGTCDALESMSVTFLFQSFLRLSTAVLKRDGTNVVTDTACHATSGNWVSPYDGTTTTNSSAFDIVSLFFHFFKLS